MTADLSTAPSSAPAELWAQLPRGLVGQLAPCAGRLAKEILSEIQQQVPVYAVPLSGRFGQYLVQIVERAIRRCFESVADPRASGEDWNAMLREAGRLEYLAGRNMDALQTAVRVGARVAWRRVAEVGRTEHIPTQTLLVLAEAIFAYVDELSTVAIEGYTQAQTQASGAVERRRRELLKLLLAQPQAPRRAIEELALAANWTLPEQISVLVLEYREEYFEPPISVLGNDVLVDFESEEPCLLAPGTGERLIALSEWLGDRRAAVGPTVPVAEAAAALDCARRTLALCQRGIIDSAGLVFSEQHLSTLVLLSDEFLAEHLAQRGLAAFAGLTDKQRSRLTATLLAWLETRGGINEIAARLEIHPQTVRYRMHQIEDLVGDKLADPHQRLELELGLRALRLTRPEVTGDEPEDHQFE
ncbi:helix-turn-helix domain-containing protein [Kutzneria viridogrisea]|uniref:PucR family transcription regulator n=2 Tax=Kutzneria TaxID=43356 RepID=W5W5S8_9PSEU|nr:helix-turn-helix domain-containing protein [Kutzneria albida]AHH96247.1 PucR family transcription regulator [Kutzneria albida DSM 43870]MBA8928540.1 hypothetical protein [Kutzneria viridogrisea]